MSDYFDTEPPPPYDPDAPAASPPPEEYRPEPWRLMFYAEPPEGAEIGREEEVLAARDQRWTGRVVILAAIAMGLFNSAALTSWASTLPPNGSTETIRAVADVWASRMADLGLDQPRAAIRKTYEAQKAKRWK